jgi:YHS domain-containing protein
MFMKLLATAISVAALTLTLSSFAAEGEFGQLCATGLSMGKEVPTDCSVNMMIDGKTYCFSSAEAKAMFEQDSQGMLAKAMENFDKLKKQ